jgi:hypothetical protein
MNPAPGKLYYTLENAWQAVTPEQEKDVLEFWERNGLSADHLDLTVRVGQAVFIARGLDRRVIGVSTAVRSFVRRLNSHVYLYRTMTGTDARYLGVGMDLLVSSRNFFNERFRNGTDTGCIGLMFVLENQEIAASYRQAVWPRTGFIFLGYDKRGRQVRIFYFDNACI